MTIEQFNQRYSHLRDVDLIGDIKKCDHPQCFGLNEPIKKVVVKRNILKHGGKEFICRVCMMKYDNPMNHRGESRQTEEMIAVVCPHPAHIGKRDRQMQKACYFGEMIEPYTQICNACSKLGQKVNQETKDKISEALTGRELSPEHIRKIMEFRKNNPEWAAKSRANLRPELGRGWNKGLETPQEVRDKISAATTGKERTPEQCTNISIGRKKMLQETGGFTLEHRENLRQAAINQYLNGFDPNLYHLSGWHISPKCTKAAFFRSSYEKRAYILLDSDPSVKSYTTEGWHVKYQHPFKNTQCTYIVDIKAERMDGTIVHVEVKPQSMLNNIIVKKKAEAAIMQSAIEGCSYEVWTEIKLFGANDPKLIAQFCEDLQKTLPDGLERRQKSLENYKERAKRHYDTKIAPNKVAFYCDFCQCEHTALRLTHNKNIARNGRYICEKEGGKIAGSRPKPHLRKENPYLAEGKKQCTKCQGILPPDCFGDDKSRADGKASLNLP